MAIKVVQILSKDNKLLGTGFFISPDGYILTCYHVIKSQTGSLYIKTDLYQDKLLAKVICECKKHDLAVLKADGIDNKELEDIAPLAEVMNWKPGDKIHSFGYPSISRIEGVPLIGNLQSLPRNYTVVRDIKGYLVSVKQEELPKLKPGFSGAPVLHLNTNRIIGVIYGSYENYIFFIPIEFLEECLKKINIKPIYGPLPLHEIMLKAKHSLIISGHTLDKFARNTEVKNALVKLFERGVHVTLILLNPHCSYAKAHEPFHKLESHGSAQEQIKSTIEFLHAIFKAYQPRTLEVLLTNYMPRFRTILIDEKLCYINLYMYGKDVNETPQFKLLKNSLWFQTISDSIHQMINSNDVIYLIKDGRFNEDWENSRAVHILNHCLQSECCTRRTECWDMIRNIILGYQNEDHQMAYSLGICNQDYKPGTFTLGSIGLSAEYLQQPITFEEWIEKVLQEELELIEKTYPSLFQRESARDIFKTVKATLNLRPIGGTSLKDEIWYQEYSDILRRLIMTLLASNPDFDLDLYPNLTKDRKDFMFKVLEWLEKFKRPNLKDWLHLSVAAGLLGIDEKPAHAATSLINPVKGIPLNKPEEDEDVAVQRVASELWEAAKSPCRIDATNVFFHTLEMNARYGFKIVSFPDDYLETIVLLKFYEKLLEHFPELEIDFIPRSVRCSNDATYNDVKEFLERFEILRKESRFRLVTKGPKIGGVNLLKLHEDVMKLIKKASILDVRGARNYEMMQGVNKEAYFGFMVCREISESITGLPAEKCPFIYLRQLPGERSFKGFTLRHKRRKNGKMFAEVTVNDQKSKWEGGHLAEYDHWPKDRQYRYKLLCTFYSDNAPEFHWKYGTLLETEVKEFLNAFSGKVLVIGCGSGKEVEYLSKRGCDVFGIDFSLEAIRLAQKEHPHLKNRFFVEDMYNLGTVITEKYDGIVANAVLVHLLDHNDMPHILRKMWSCLRDNGLCFIRVIEKEKLREEFDKHLFGDLRWFVYYTKEEMERFCEEAGFTIERIDKRPHAQYPGVYWISVLSRKKQEVKF